MTFRTLFDKRQTIVLKFTSEKKITLNNSYHAECVAAATIAHRTKIMHNTLQKSGKQNIKKIYFKNFKNNVCTKKNSDTNHQIRLLHVLETLITEMSAKI